MLIAGVDEVGVSALAGPLVAGAVVFDTHDCPTKIQNIWDSKKLKKLHGSEGIERGYERVMAHCKAWAVASIPPMDVDIVNVRRSQMIALSKALANLRAISNDEPEYVWIDGELDPCYTAAMSRPNCICISEPRADEKFWVVAAASVVAKHVRDTLMVDMHESMSANNPAFAEYGFDTNFGYRSPAHLEAIRRNGWSPLHRRRFKDCKREQGLFLVNTQELEIV